MSRKKPGNYQIPFHRGNLCHYPSWPTEPTEWRDNYEFTATLTYQGYRRGRSAAYIEFTDDEGHLFSMFLTHFDEVVKIMERGKVTASWTFCKCGQNYGLCSVPQ